MAGRIRDEDIATVRERSPIDEVVGDYLQLRNAGGGSLKGLCPFHDEKTPSFNVTPSRGLYYCFSCAEGGDVISFVQKVDGLSFAEAVERLAARAGIELRYEQGGHVPGQEQGLRRRLIAAHKAAADFYTERLRSDDAAAGREFLASRGFDLEQAEQFGVGYAPDAWEALTGHLRGRGFTDADSLTGGLAREGLRGPVDRFRGRLIWPIRDLTGDVIAFGARKLAAHDDGPKYLNTPETRGCRTRCSRRSLPGSPTRCPRSTGLSWTSPASPPAPSSGNDPLGRQHRKPPFFPNENRPSPREIEPEVLVGGPGDSRGRGLDLLVRLGLDDLTGRIQGIPDIGEPGADRGGAEPEPVGGAVVAHHSGLDQGLAHPPSFRVAQADVRAAPRGVPRRRERAAQRGQPRVGQGDQVVGEQHALGPQRPDASLAEQPGALLDGDRADDVG